MLSPSEDVFASSEGPQRYFCFFLFFVFCFFLKKVPQNFTDAYKIDTTLKKEIFQNDRRSHKNLKNFDNVFSEVLQIFSQNLQNTI